ncbi:MAG: hypothetical protein V6Z82_04430 [Flavobacteriales bacterium]
MKSRILLVFLSSLSAYSNAQLIPLESDTAAFNLRNHFDEKFDQNLTKGRPLFRSPVFNFNNQFNLSVFSQRVDHRSAVRNRLFRKKVELPDYVYKNLGYFMRGINADTDQNSNHTFEFHIDRCNCHDRYDPFDNSQPSIYPFANRFHFYPYVPSGVIYGLDYWGRFPVY